MNADVNVFDLNCSIIEIYVMQFLGDLSRREGREILLQILIYYTTILSPTVQNMIKQNLDIVLLHYVIIETLYNNSITMQLR